MTIGPPSALHNISEEDHQQRQTQPQQDMQPPQPPPFEIHASGKTTQEKRPSSIGFREGSDDTVSEISDGNEWFYETICSKFDEDAIPSTIQEYRSRARETNQRKAKAKAKTSRPATAAGAHQAAEPANVDDLMAENIQLKEINKSVWRELQSLRQRSQKVNDDAERTRRHVRSAAGSIESLQEQLATSLSLVDSLEKEKEDHGRQIDDLQTMVSDLTEKLAATITELNTTKEQLQRKERKVDMLENSIRMSSRDLDRTRRSLREKVRKNICMELEIETLHEDLNEERTSHAGSSSNNSDPSNRCSTSPGIPRHHSHRSVTPLEAKISSGRRIGDTATTAGTGASIPTSLLEAKLADIVEELDTVKATSAQEKLDLEERHRSQLKRVVDEHDAEKDDLLRQMNALEKMVLSSEAHHTTSAASSGNIRRSSRRPRATPQASASDTALTSSTKNTRGIHLKSSASLSQRRRRPSHDSNPYLQAFGGAISADDHRRSSNLSLEPKSLDGDDDYHHRHLHPIPPPPSSLQDANRSSKSNTSRNPQQDSSSTCDANSIAEISEQVRQRAMAA